VRRHAVHVKIPAPIRPLAGGRDMLEVEAGATLGELITTLAGDYPALAERIVDEDGRLRRFVNVYVDGEDVRFLDDLGTPLRATSVVTILPAVAGGSGPEALFADRR
jgi:molybdopterin synthase sulfur carrier subunit